MSNNDHSFDSSTISDEAPIIDSNLNTDPKNASFTIDDIINYGGEYEKSLPRQSADIVDKYFHIFSSRESEKLANAISPYKTQRVSWMTLYDKIIRKIINPFNVNGNKSYVTLQEIENRINVVVYNDNDRKKRELIAKENENFIPKIMRMFTYDRNNKAKKEIEKTIDASTSSASNKKIGMILRRRSTTTSIKFKSNNLINSNNTNSNNIPKNDIPVRQRGFSYRKLSSFNLDNLQRAYDSHNSLLNRINSKNGSTLNVNEQNVKSSNMLNRQKTASSFSLISTNKNNNNGMNNSSSVKNLPKSRKMSCIAMGSYLKPVKEGVMGANEKKVIPLDPMRAYKQIPKMEYKNNNGIYKKMEKLAYKDEINDYKHSSVNIEEKREGSTQDKNVNGILNLIAFHEDNELNNIDNENDLNQRGERIATYKQIADDIYNLLILDSPN